MEENELERALIETIRKADLSDLSASAMDTAMDAAGQIPVIGLLQKLWEAASSVQTYFFMKKMIRFLTELKDVPFQERQSQIAKLDIVPGEREKAGESILLLLDRLNDMRKPAMAGRAFKAYLEGKISREQLDTLNFAIDRLDVSCVPTIERLYRLAPGGQGVYYRGAITERHSMEDYGYHQLQHLATVGLVDIYFTEIDTTPRFDEDINHRRPTGGFHPNRLGELFRLVVLT